MRTEDHSKWAQEMIRLTKQRQPRKREATLAADHKGWFAAPDVLNPFQVRALNILGIIAGGIYNAPINWRTTIWYRDALIVQWHKTLATHDFSELSWFVYLCQCARIRGNIGPKDFHRLEISLHERNDSTSMVQGHPNIAEFTELFERVLPADSIIHYRRED